MARTPSKKRRKDGKFRVYAAGKYFESAISWSDANKKAQAYKREIENGLNADAHNMTVKQYALRWLPLHKKGVKDKTYNQYARALNKLIGEIGDIPMNQVTLDDALEAYQKIYPPKACVGDKEGYSGSVMKTAKMIYRELFDSAVENGYSRRNPFRSEKFKPTMGVDGSHREITDAERKLIHEVNHPFRLAVMTMLYAGLRRGEVLALNIDTDIKDGNIYVRQAVSYTSNQPIIGTPKTDNSIRSVPILPPLAQALEGKSGLVAPSTRSKDIMSEQSFSNAWASYVLCMECHINGDSSKRWHGLRKSDRLKDPIKYAAIKHLIADGKRDEADALRLSDWKAFTVRPHDLRHSFCTMCRDAGVDIKQTIEWMGHADEKMILKIYDHVTTRRSQKSIQKVQDFLISVLYLGDNLGQSSL